VPFAIPLYVGLDELTILLCAPFIFAHSKNVDLAVGIDGFHLYYKQKSSVVTTWIAEVRTFQRVTFVYQVEHCWQQNSTFRGAQITGMKFPMFRMLLNQKILLQAFS